MKRENVILIAALFLAQFCCGSLWARPTTDYEVEMLVTGWLRADPQPLDMILGQKVMNIETFTDDDGRPIYHIVYLQPSGFVIVSADDLLEPIIGFASDGIYAPSPDNPLGALVTNDLNGRVAAVRGAIRLQAMAEAEAVSLTDTQKKWSHFINLGETRKDSIRVMGLTSLSDVRVAPLIETRWDQGDDTCGNHCYNYYTPNNYKCGCNATAMAQVLRYHQHPTTGIGVHDFTICVDGVERTASTRGGNGRGGPYPWSQMVYVPDCRTTLAQRQAIGALCYDASVAIHTTYTASTSTGGPELIRIAFTATFNYTNAVYGVNTGSNFRAMIDSMINTNLDANLPVILGLNRKQGVGHTVVCDGYGYNASTLYHHINMGHRGNEDAWYNLPAIDTPTPWDTVNECVYNIFTSGSGEIISGRVTDLSGNPISDANVTAINIDGNDVQTAQTNAKSIYALVGLKSESRYTINVDKQGCLFEPKEVRTGSSINEFAKYGKPVANVDPGNRWGINFAGTRRCNTLTIGTGTPADPYRISTAEELNTVCLCPSDWDKCFQLTADIDLSGFSYDRAPIAPNTDPNNHSSVFQGTPFRGVFDGNAHTISHLTITGEGYVGLFGQLADGGEVKNLGVVDVNVTGSGYCVGGLAGNNAGAVTCCFSTGIVRGGSLVGGLLGWNAGHVTECYSAATVRGGWSVGGLVGSNSGTVTDCHSTGVVSGQNPVGGLVGSGSPNHVTASFWDLESARRTTSSGGTGKTTAEMQTATTFLEAGWDFVDETANGTEDIWWIDEGKDYPRLWWELLKE